VIEGPRFTEPLPISSPPPIDPRRRVQVCHRFCPRLPSGVVGHTPCGPSHRRAPVARQRRYDPYLGCLPKAAPPAPAPVTLTASHDGHSPLSPTGAQAIAAKRAAWTGPKFKTGALSAPQPMRQRCAIYLEALPHPPPRPIWPALYPDEERVAVRMIHAAGLVGLEKPRTVF